MFERIRGVAYWQCSRGLSGVNFHTRAQDFGSGIKDPEQPTEPQMRLSKTHLRGDPSPACGFFYWNLLVDKGLGSPCTQGLTHPQTQTGTVYEQGGL